MSLWNDCNCEDKSETGACAADVPLGSKPPGVELWQSPMDAAFVGGFRHSGYSARLGVRTWFTPGALQVFFGLLILAFGVCPLFADTITLYPVADTSLFGDDATNNLGAELSFAAGTTDAFTGKTNRALIKFNLATSIPSNAVVTSATLSLIVTNVPGQGRVDSFFGLRRVLRDWGEGTKRNIAGPGHNGALATTGEATWLHRFFPDALWSVPGAAAPVDFTNQASATTMVRGLGTYTFASTPNLVADVQFWLNNPRSNFGWLIRSENETNALTNRRFVSREDTNNAPRLVVEFTAGGGLRFDRIVRNGTNVQLQF